MKNKMVTFRGLDMIEGWPARIRKAQKQLAYVRGGVEKQRVRYGDEATDWKADTVPCHDCKVIKGELHVPSCDVEECPACGGQLLSCECEWAEGKLGKPKKATKPFSKRELQIIAARRPFKWRHVGFKENGNAIFEVTGKPQGQTPIGPHCEPHVAFVL
ncbi:MAG TPA: hypothetical protein VK629_12655 [Steroidobacteraceae bacterium]|nr:hypothetical protein [Steroidobacteraceae bacterium]